VATTTPPTLPPPVRKGDRLSARWLNSLRGGVGAALSSLDALHPGTSATNMPPNLERWWWGEITEATEAPKYKWKEIYLPTSSGGKLTWTDRPVAEYPQHEITEGYAWEVHNDPYVEVGRRVLVWQSEDENGEPVFLFDAYTTVLPGKLISESGGVWTVQPWDANNETWDTEHTIESKDLGAGSPQANDVYLHVKRGTYWYFSSQVGSATTVHPAVAYADYNTANDPPTVQIQLCDDWQGNNPGATVYTCVLPYTTGNYPNVRAGDVIGVIADGSTDSGADYVAVTGYLDAPIGAVRAWVGALGDIPDGWEVFAEGRFLVGYCSGDKDFGGLGDTGGQKTHTHTPGDGVTGIHDADWGVGSDCHDHALPSDLLCVCTEQICQGTETPIEVVTSVGLNYTTTCAEALIDDGQKHLPPYEVVYWIKRVN